MRVVIAGAGFGGLEIATCLSEALGDGVDVTLIDKNDSFVLGYAKLDVMFGRTAPEAIHLPYGAFAKRGVTFRQELVTALDPATRRVVTDWATYDADILVVALGADYDVGATPGLADGGHEFYSVAGAKRLRDLLPTFQGGTVVVGVMTPHYKCPPAPSEAAMLMHDYLTARGIRDRSRIVMTTPLPSPIPVSKAAGDGILARFAELGIECISGAATTRVDAATHTLRLATGEAIPFDLLLAVPVHVAPQVVLESGLAEGGWIPVEKGTLKTRFPDVYAVGDVTSVGTPRWQRVYNAGARPQRLLWASTGTKDPKASDVLYATALAAPFTVNTMPEGTLRALGDHGEIGDALPADGGDCEQVLAQFARAGVNVNAMAAQLQDEGAKAFVKSWNELLGVIASKSAVLGKAS